MRCHCFYLRKPFATSTDDCSCIISLYPWPTHFFVIASNKIFVFQECTEFAECSACHYPLAIVVIIFKEVLKNIFLLILYYNKSYLCGLNHDVQIFLLFWHQYILCRKFKHFQINNCMKTIYKFTISLQIIYVLFQLKCHLKVHQAFYFKSFRKHW